MNKHPHLGSHCEGWSPRRRLALGAQNLHGCLLRVEDYDSLGKRGKVDDVAMFLGWLSFLSPS